MTIISSFTTTPIYNAPAIRFPQSGSIGEIEIPLHITKLVAQNPEPAVTEITYGSVIDTVSNMSAGGSAVGYGVNKLPKITVEGWVDTPITAITVNQPGMQNGELPGLIIDGYNVTYGEIIAAYFEGRTAIGTNSTWTLVNPKWFRDGFGRVYSNVRILDLTLTRVEAVPYRNTFTMILTV